MVVLLSRQQSDVIRGMAAIIIAIFHVLIEWQCPRVVNIFGSVCVAAFLFLSGFGIHESYKKNGLSRYWVKKWKRIILPYWLFLSVVTLFQGWPGWKTFLLDACFVQSQFWFIPYLVQCYLVYWIISRCLSHYWVIAFLVIGFIALNTLPQIEAEQSFSFFAGVLASRHIDFLRRLSHSQLLSFGLASMLCGILFLLLKEIPAVHAYKGTVPYNYILLFIKLPLAVPLILLPEFLPILQSSRLLHGAGIASLEIYLVHLPFVPYVEQTVWSVCVFVLVVVVCSYVYYQINHQLISKYL